jgi:hypothetical protein
MLRCEQTGKRADNTGYPPMNWKLAALSESRKSSIASLNILAVGLKGHTVSSYVIGDGFPSSSGRERWGSETRQLGL